MDQYMHLIGSEEVRTAANVMAGAAHSIGRSVAELDDVLLRHRRELREFMACPICGTPLPCESCLRELRCDEGV